MSDNFYPSMYGANGKKPEKKEPPKPVPTNPAPVTPPAHQRLSGLKITNSHMFEVEINGRNVTIPSVAYVKLLEDQVKEFRNLVREQQNKVTRLTNAVQRLSNEIDKIKNTNQPFRGKSSR